MCQRRPGEARVNLHGPEFPDPWRLIRAGGELPAVGYFGQHDAGVSRLIIRLERLELGLYLLRGALV